MAYKTKAECLAIMESAWNVSATTPELHGVDFALGRGIHVNAFGVIVEVPFKLDAAPGCVINYSLIGVTQGLADAMMMRSVCLLNAPDGLWFASLAKSSLHALEISNPLDTWPTASHGRGGLVYRISRDAITRLDAPVSRH